MKMIIETIDGIVLITFGAGENAVTATNPEIFEIENRRKENSWDNQYGRID